MVTPSECAIRRRNSTASIADARSMLTDRQPDGKLSTSLRNSQVLPAPGSPVIKTGPAGPFLRAARNRSSASRRLETTGWELGGSVHRPVALSRPCCPSIAAPLPSRSHVESSLTMPETGRKPARSGCSVDARTAMIHDKSA